MSGKSGTLRELEYLEGRKQGGGYLGDGGRSVGTCKPLQRLWWSPWVRGSYRKAPNMGGLGPDLVVHRFPLTASGEQTLGTGEAGKEGLM